MRVILLAPTPPPTGGIAGWTLRMQSANLKNNWEVSVVDEKMIGERSEKGGSHRKKISDEYKRCKEIWDDLRRQLQKQDVAIVQACIPSTKGALLREIISAKITKKYKRKFIIHFRCTVPNMVKSWLSKALLRKLLKYSDYAFCLNKQTQDFIQSIDPKMKTKVIPNFVDLTEAYERKEYRSQIRKVVYTGRLYEGKGCLQIIEVAKLHPDIQFELIGKVMVELINLPPNVVITGEKDRHFIQEELRKADVFLFPSYFSGEGFSNSLAEAMAFSLPCIVTDWAANTDMIEDKGGIVLKSNKPDEISRALLRLRDPDLREEMGKWNYQKVQNAYNQKIVTNMYVDCYEELLKE